MKVEVARGRDRDAELLRGDMRLDQRREPGRRPLQLIAARETGLLHGNELARGVGDGDANMAKLGEPQTARELIDPLGKVFDLAVGRQALNGRAHEALGDLERSLHLDVRRRARDS